MVGNMCSRSPTEPWCWLYPNIYSILNGNSFASTTNEYVFKGAMLECFSDHKSQLNTKSNEGETVFISCLLVRKQTPIQPDPIEKGQLENKLNPVLWIILCSYFFLKELSLGVKLCSLTTISVQRNTRIKFGRLLKSWTMPVCTKLWLFSYTELPSDWQRGQSNFGPPDGWKAPSSRTQC